MGAFDGLVALVVEKDDALRKLLRMVLEHDGMTVLVARNGEEACNVFSAWRRRLDLLVMDLETAGNGAPLAERILGVAPRVRVLVTTVEADRSLQQQVSKAGWVLVDKPFRIQTLRRECLQLLCDRLHSAASL